MIKDIIDKKRLGKSLSYDEIYTIFMGYLNGKVKDYQMSSLLMAICINGMEMDEVYNLTDIFIKSGDVLDFSDIPAVKVDKHSTGGIGDKTTLVIVPIVASLGIPVVKFSGRGLGYTGGTIDKLESIPGYRIDLSNEEIFDSVKKVGAVITGQTSNLVPLDKVIYALRDVTATVSSIPLIAVSIMSKKIASGADKILLDVKYGSGALVSTKEEALQLAEIMQKIGNKYEREVRYVLTPMDSPLGYYVGNSLEVVEAINTLKGEEVSDFSSLSIELASIMVSMAKGIKTEDAKLLVLDAIESGKAYDKFLEIVKNQHGDINLLKISDKVIDVYSEKSGVIKSVDALKIGKLSLSLGAGRREKEDKIDYSVGIELVKKPGDRVNTGDILMKLYVKDDNLEIENDIFEIE